MPAGRPREYDREKVLSDFLEYIEKTEIPIVAEFASNHGLTRQFLYDNEEFTVAISRCTFKKEAALERMALQGKVNTTMAVFSLKQLGWTDRQDVTHKGDKANPIMIHPTAAGW
jgi:hypothetical protein